VICSWISNCQIMPFVAHKQRLASLLSFFQLSALSWNMHFLSLYFWTHHVSKFAKRFLATVRITLSKNSPVIWSYLHFILHAVMAKTCLSDCCVNAVFSLRGWILFPEKENKHMYERHHKTWHVYQTTRFHELS